MTPRPAPPLHGAQRLFADAIMATQPEQAVSLAQQAEALLTDGPRMRAAERLAVYRRGYLARLIECLADDYPALRWAYGVEGFESLCHRYIAAHPSTEPSLNWFGRHMATFCATHGGLDDPEFASDLARLEWSMVEVIHAPVGAKWTLASLGAVSVDSWANARLKVTPACRLLELDYPVDTFYQAFREGQVKGRTPAERSWLAVVRDGPTVWRMPLTVTMFDLLSALSRGEPLGAALERAAGVDEAESDPAAGARVMRWFRDWVASGFFSGVDLSG